MNPSAKKDKAQVDETSIGEYLKSKIGIEPNAWGSKRRWLFLRTMAKHIFERKRLDFQSFFVWTTAHCQCMKMRTLREDYLDTLERLDIVKVDWNTGSIRWLGGNVVKKIAVYGSYEAKVPTKQRYWKKRSAR